MPMIPKFTCLYQPQTQRNLLISCNIVSGSKLNLYPSKTEFLLIVTKLQWEKLLNNLSCLILGQDTNPSTSAKTFGVLFDSSLNFRKHKSQTCRACFCNTVACVEFEKNCSYIRSRFDYCNPLFPNMPEKDIARLQRVQNCLARVVTKAPRFSFTVPILKRLHWLPVTFCIHLKYAQ